MANRIGRLLSRIGGLIRRDASGPSLLASMSNFMGDSPRPTVHNMRQYLGRYADQPWVYSCIRIIQTKAASVPLKIYKKIGDKRVEQPDHPLQSLLTKVNPFMEGYDLREGTHGFEELTGNAYWMLDSYFNGKPTEIYLLNPSRMEVIADAKKYISGYKYKVDPSKDAITFDISEILHFKKWNPLDDFYGMAPLSASRDASDSMMSADRYNKAFFENAAEPSGVLSIDGKLGEPAKRRIAEAWKKMHSGVRKAHKIAVLEGGMKYTSLAASHRDMMFPDLKRMTREDILTIYTVPPIMVGVYDEANYSNAKEQRRIFWLDCIMPRLKKFESVINERLVKPYDPSVFIKFDTSGSSLVNSIINPDLQASKCPLALPQFLVKQGYKCFPLLSSSSSSSSSGSSSSSPGSAKSLASSIGIRPIGAFQVSPQVTGDRFLRFRTSFIVMIPAVVYAASVLA